MWRSSFGTRWRTAVFCAALALLVNHEASAQTWNIIVNGRAIHVGATREWNEANWGLGFEREFRSSSRWVTAVLANGFRDSDDAMSYMAGGSIKRRFPIGSAGRRLHVDVGVAGFLMTREDVRDNRRFPGVLPTMTVGTRHFGVNLSYVPGRWADRVTAVSRADPGIEGIYFVQLKLVPKALRSGVLRPRLAREPAPPERGQRNL
jgi:hypothetical protein